MWMHGFTMSSLRTPAARVLLLLKWFARVWGQGGIWALARQRWYVLLAPSGGGGGGPWQVESARALAASAPSNNHPCARSPPPPTKTQPQFRRGQCEGRIYRVECKCRDCSCVSLDCASQGCHEAETERQSLTPSAGRTASRVQDCRSPAERPPSVCVSA